MDLLPLRRRPHGVPLLPEHAAVISCEEGDTHAAIRKLQDADLSERQAEALVEVFSNAVGDPLTRTDLDAFKSDIRAELAALDARIGTLEARITWRIVLALGAFAALVRLIP